MHQKSAYALRQSFVEGRLTASEIAASFLERIQVFDRDIQAFLDVFSVRVMKKAKELEVGYMEVSAKTGDNVQNLFKDIANKLSASDQTQVLSGTQGGN